MAPPGRPKTGRRLRPGRTGSKIGADRKRGQTMRKNPLASAIRGILTPQFAVPYNQHCPPVDRQEPPTPGVGA